MYEKIKTVLFASDLTENSRQTFFYAASMGMLYNVDIVFLHIIEKIPAGMQLRLAGLDGEELLKRLKEARKHEAMKVLIGKKSDTFLRTTLCDFYADAGKACAIEEFEIKDIVIKEGDIAKGIINTAKEFDCNLIVMGAHRGLLGATGIGSATRTVLNKSKIPVLVVPVE